VVLDYFVGGGTTAVEAKLLGRRCIARDINPAAVALTLQNLDFSVPRKLFGEGALPVYQPQVAVGDARELRDIPDSTIDLICAHPPYAGIVKYGSDVPGDLSALSLDRFLLEMSTVAAESLRVLKPGGKCAILLGDGRKHKRVLPIGFHTIRLFLEAGFNLRELAIKRQHNCKTTGFWYRRSIQHNFLLLAHEYLPVFEKPEPDSNPVGVRQEASFSCHSRETVSVASAETGHMETTTVWVFPPADLAKEVRRNLLARLSPQGEGVVEVSVAPRRSTRRLKMPSGASLVRVLAPETLATDAAVDAYRSMVQSVVDQASRALAPGGYVVLETQDVRVGDLLRPTALILWQDMLSRSGFELRELVVVLPECEPGNATTVGGPLRIVHTYLLVYSKRETAE
jgi:SAM-dependent methyltransferase